MAAVKDELTEAVATPSDEALAAPESFIAYIPAPRGERRSVRFGQAWENNAGAGKTEGKDGKGEATEMMMEMVLCGNSS